MRKITEIIVHCTATPAGRQVSVADVDSWHRRQGLSSIGYHYLVGLDGAVGRGRPEAAVGAHCRGHNACSIGVCYVGGCDAQMRPADTRTPAQRRALVGLLKELRGRYPQAVIHSHRDFSTKACPSFDATAEYASL